jgi:hypothetical protein
MDFGKYKSSSSAWNKSDEDRKKEEEQRVKAEKVQAMFNNMATPSTTPIQKNNLIELNQPLSSNLVDTSNLVPKLENQPFKSTLTNNINPLTPVNPIKKDTSLLKKPDFVQPTTPKTFATEKVIPKINTAISVASDILDRPRNALAAAQEAETTARTSTNFLPKQTGGEALIQGLLGKKKTSFIQAGLGNKLAANFEQTSPIIAGVGNFIGEALTDPTNILGTEALGAIAKGTKIGNKAMNLIPSIAKKTSEEAALNATKQLGNKIVTRENNITNYLKNLEAEKSLFDMGKNYLNTTDKSNFVKSDLRNVPYSKTLQNLKQELDPNVIKSNLQNVNDTATKPLTRQEFNTKYKLDNNLVGLTPEQSNSLARESVNKLQQDIGTRVINRLGTTDMQQIADFYKQKYNLPNITVVEGKVKGNLSTSAISPNRDLSGYTITIDPNKLSTLEHKVGVLRHEIEHSIDLASNYKPDVVSRKGVIPSTVDQLYTQGSKGHHKNYDWFEADYLYNRTNQDLGLDNTIPSNQMPTQNIQTPGQPPILETAKTLPQKQLQQSLPISNSDKLALGNTPQVNATPNNLQVATKIESSIPNKESILFDQGKNLNQQQNIGNIDIKKEANNTIKAIDDTFSLNPKKTNIEPVLKERGFSKNVRSDANMNADIRESFDENPLMKDTLTNQTTVKKAQQRYNKGFDIALKELENSSKTLDSSDVPLARMLANDAANRGDIDTARAIISNIAEKLTETGRFSQAARILRKSDPVVFENYITKTIDKLNKEGQKVYGTKWKDLQLGSDIVDEIYNMKYLDEAAREKVMNSVHDRLAQEIPVTKLEKFNTWRRMAMLLNPTTHVRNVVGNALVVPLRKSSDTMAAVLEKAFVKNGEKTKGFGWSLNKDIKKMVNDDWDNVAKADLTTNSKYKSETLGSLEANKPIFKNKQLEGLNKLSNFLLDAGDTPFVKRAYEDALGGYIQANKLTNVTDTAREYAKRRALEATYKQSNLFSTFMSNAKGSSKFANVALEALMPFSKTPSNILLQSVDYSPLGLIKALAQAGGKKSASTVIETLAKSIVGSSVAGLGFFLGSMGFGRGAASESLKVENLKKESGSQEYSINTPFGSYTFDWAQPFSVPLAMGMEASNSLKDNTNALNAVYKGLASGGDTLFNMSMLKSIKDTFGGQGSTSEKLLKAPINYMVQAYPSMFGKISKIADDEVRNTMGKTQLDTTINQLKSKIPIVSENLPAKYDMFGNKETTGNVAERSLQNILSPGFAKSYNNDKIVRELQVLNKKTGDSSMIPKILTQTDAKELGMDAKQMSQFQKIMGQTAKKEMDYIISTAAYQKASDAAKVSKLASIVKDSYDTALEDYTVETKVKTKEQKAAAKVKSKEVESMTKELKVFRKK